MTYSRSKNQKKKSYLFISLSLIIAVGAILFYMYGYLPAAEKDRIHIRFKEALLEEDRTFFEETVEYQSEDLTRAEAIRFIRWLNDDKTIRSEALAEIERDRANRDSGLETDGLFRLIDTGEGKFGFSDYRIELLPQTIDVKSDAPLTNIWVDGERVGRIDEADGSFEFERMPGRYDIKAVAVVDGETVSESENISLTEAVDLTYTLVPEKSQAIAGQFDLKRVELIEIEVEARTGYKLATIDGLVGEKKATVLDRIGEPNDKTKEKWQYEEMDISFENGRVDAILINLDKRPDDLIALLGEPVDRNDHAMGTEWDYGKSFFESFFTFFGLQTEKQFIERDAQMYLLIQ